MERRRLKRVRPSKKEDRNMTEIKPIQVGIIVCPDFAALDIFGVYTVFGVPPVLGMHPITTHLIWKNTDELNAMPPLFMRPTTTFQEAPDLDVLALGALPASFLEDDEAMDFVARAGAQASYLIGICGGSLVLGAAGLLEGRKATTNFHSLECLKEVGAVPAAGHVVVDGNLYTSGPSIGAYDASLMVLGRLCGDDVAREIELQLEHRAEPPYNTGRPDLAGEELTKTARERLYPLIESTHRAVAAAARKRVVA